MIGKRIFSGFACPYIIGKFAGLVDGIDKVSNGNAFALPRIIIGISGIGTVNNTLCPQGYSLIDVVIG
jgi:hypothetical protein